MVPTKRRSLAFIGLAVASAFCACSSDATDQDPTGATKASAELTPKFAIDDLAGPMGGTRFQLSGGGVQVAYGLADGVPVFSYQDARQDLVFRGDDIESATTSGGTIVSVVIRRTIDQGSTSFTLLVPRVDMLPGASVSVQTQAFTTIHRLCIGPSRFCQGQLDAYEIVSLQGTAASIERGPAATD